MFAKLFLSGHYFTIGIRRKSDSDMIGDPGFQCDYVVPATVSEWAADPILVDHGDRTYLFYEAVTGVKGRIEVAEVREDCTLADPVVLFAGEHHYSYPFVFSCGDEWFMVPETSSQKEISLYRAVNFPYQWEKYKVLLNNISAVDTTVFTYEGRIYLTTYQPDGVTERVVPSAYRLVPEENYRLIPLPWGTYDTLQCRGAGPYFSQGGKLYRPAQVSSETLYGNAVAFYEVRIDREGYHETIVSQLTPSRLKTPGKYCDGLHTYASSSRFEAIDMRCRDIDPLKIFRKIKQRLLNRTA